MIHLNIGSNLSSKFGNRFDNISMAIDLLINSKIKINKISSYYKTPSYPNKKHPYYLNVGISANYENNEIVLINEISLIEKREYYNLNVIQKEINNLKKINFKWADYDINRSEIKIINKYNYIKIFMISAILGLLISLVYVFVASAFQSQRPNNEIK